MENVILGSSLGATVNIPKYIVIHCTDVSYKVNSDQFKSTNDYHRDVREFPISSLGFYVGYQYLYTGGREYICRKESDVGAHCNQGFDGTTVYEPGTPGKLSMNYQSIGLCCGFDGDIEKMPDAEYKLLQNRVWDIQNRYGINQVFFHRHFATSKTCPGGLINDQWLSALLKRPSDVPSSSCTAVEAENVRLKVEVSMWKQAYQWIDEALKKYFK